MNTQEQLTLFAIAATVIMSFTYFLVLEKAGKRKKECNERKKKQFFIFRKGAGFILYGGIPAMLAWGLFGYSLKDAGLGLGASIQLWPWIAAAAIFFVFLNLLNSRNAGIRANYPEMRLSSWGWGATAISALGWILYLTAYEFLFRGLLLFTTYESYGLWPAVVINLSLYATLHLPKGMKEAIATVPFGAVIIYLTLQTGSILPAILIHSLQAISCELSCIYRNPEMKFNLFNQHRHEMFYHRDHRFYRF